MDQILAKNAMTTSPLPLPAKPPHVDAETALPRAAFTEHGSLLSPPGKEPQLIAEAMRHVELPIQVPPLAAAMPGTRPSDVSGVSGPSHSAWSPDDDDEPRVRIGDPEELIDLLKARSGCIIVGAGVSVALAAGSEMKRLVTWRGFLDKLAETVAYLLNLPNSWLAQIREHLSRASSGPSPAPDLQVAAELIAEQCAGKDPFMRYNHLVFKILHGLKAEENSMLAKSLDMLGRLGDSPIMTTNYDVLLEDATGRFTLSIDDLLKAQRWHRVDPKDHPAPLESHQSYVFHLHGLFYDDPDKKFVLTSKEYSNTIDEFTIALKPVLIDAESGSVSGAPIVRSSIYIPELAHPVVDYNGALPPPAELVSPAPRPRSRISVYSTNGDAVNEEGSANGVGNLGMSPKYRPLPNPHQHDHPKSKKERRSSARSSSVGPVSPAMKFTNGEVPEPLNLSQTVPLPRRTASPVVGGSPGLKGRHGSSRLASDPFMLPDIMAPRSPSLGPSNEGYGTGFGPTLAFHRSMIFIGVGGTLQDVHFTSLFAALQEHNVFLHHNGLARIKHYVLVKDTELDSVMDFCFYDSLGREVPARELLVAIVYGKDYEELPFFLAGLAQRLEYEVRQRDGSEQLAHAASEALRLDETRHKAKAYDAFAV